MGEEQISIDPLISEWGNPITEKVITLLCKGQTRGTETSKYPEEKKTKVIPEVVASEPGQAQTSTV